MPLLARSFVFQLRRQVPSIFFTHTFFSYSSVLQLFCKQCAFVQCTLSILSAASDLGAFVRKTADKLKNKLTITFNFQAKEGIVLNETDKGKFITHLGKIIFKGRTDQYSCVFLCQSNYCLPKTCRIENFVN